jgi:hypothetical protein
VEPGVKSGTVRCPKCKSELYVGNGMKNVKRVIGGHRAWCKPRISHGNVYQTLMRSLNETECPSGAVAQTDSQDHVSQPDNNLENSHYGNVGQPDDHLEDPPCENADRQNSALENQACGNVSRPDDHFEDQRCSIDVRTTGYKDPDLVGHTQWTVANRLEQAMQASIAADTYYCYRKEHVQSTENEDVIENQFMRIVSDFQLQPPCTKRIARFINKNFVSRDHQTLMLGRQHRTEEDQLRLPIRSGIIYYGMGLPSAPLQGIPYAITYYDPMSLIARRATEILHKFGREAFSIEKEPINSFETAQHSKLLAKAARFFGDPEGLIIPVKIHADGAHLRGNGMHHRTPLFVSIVHRYLFEEPVFPELVTVIKPIEGSQSTAQMRNPSLHHAVLDALFGPVRNQNEEILSANPISRVQNITISFNRVKIRCYLVVFKLSLDMPMIATCSLTKNSRPMEQRFPCQQCLLPGKTKAYFLAPADALKYRIETDMLRFIYRPGFEEQRKVYNLRRLGQPAFINMLPFDKRGIFLLAAADGLHAFKGMWLRSIVNIGLYTFYLHGLREFDDSDEENPAIPHSDSDTSLALTKNGRPSKESRLTIDFDYYPSDLEGSENEASVSARSSDGMESWPSDSEDGMVCAAPQSDSSRRGSMQLKRSRNDGLMKIGNIPDRVRAILNTKRGRELVSRASRIHADLMNRKGSMSIPIRRRSLVQQITKLQEHKYSLGLLLQLMAIVGCDDSAGMMGVQYRRLWLNVAAKCIRIYALLYQRQPTSRKLLDSSILIKEILSDMQILEETIGFVWFPPKKHLLLHFPDMIKEFGRMRYFDTVDGESAIKYLKRCYSSISNRDVYENFEKPLLERTQELSLKRIRKIAVCSRVENRSNISWRFVGSKQGRSADSLDFTYDFTNVVLNKEKWHSPGFPLKKDEHKEALLCSIQNALLRYIQRSTFSSVGIEGPFCGLLFVEKTAVRTDEQGNNMTTSATESRYGYRRYDFVSYKYGTDVRYGELIMLATMCFDEQERSLAFINAFQTSSHVSACKLPCRCSDFQGVFTHARVRRWKMGMKAIDCVDIGCIKERITGFLDLKAEWQPPFSDSVDDRLWPHAEWYFLVNPDVFVGVETYA